MDLGLASARTPMPELSILALSPPVSQYEAVSGLGIIRRDVEPDVVEVRPRGIRQPILAHEDRGFGPCFKRSLPVRPTSSANCIRLESS